MGIAKARQSAEGVTIELVLTPHDIQLAAQGEHHITVTIDPASPVTDGTDGSSAVVAVVVTLISTDL